MKRVFIAIQYLEIGGAERSLIGLLSAIDYTRYEVDLFVYRHTGEFMSFIPKEVRLLPEIKKFTTLSRPIKEIVKEEDLQFLAESAYADACAPGNPKDASVEDIIGLYKSLL